VEAVKMAYEMAGLGPEDVDVAEVHDCFTIAEIVAYEDCGFAKPGEGERLIEEKQTYLEVKSQSTWTEVSFERAPYGATERPRSEQL
jgi:acetyl-CoA acetyltransferase